MTSSCIHIYVNAEIWWYNHNKLVYNKAIYCIHLSWDVYSMLPLYMIPFLLEWRHWGRSHFAESLAFGIILLHWALSSFWSMMPLSIGNIFRVTGPLCGSPVNSPHKGQWRGALMFSLICALNRRLSKQSWGWWFETQSSSLWRHCDANNKKEFPSYFIMKDKKFW